MSTALTAAPAGRQDPSAQLRTQLASMSNEFKNALPLHIKPEKFQRVVMTVVQQQPALMNADRKTLLASCLKCAADGLIPDGREAALVLFSNQVQYMPMLAGIQKRIRNSGEVASIEAHVIYANDHFVWRQGMESTIEHVPLFPGERGQAIGAYAVAKFKDGSAPQFEVMDRDAIEKVRAVSRAKNNGPWVQWWDEMARKTVFRRLSKWLPMDTDPEDLLRRDDELGDTVTATAQVVPMIQQAPTSRLDALEPPDDLANRIAEAVGRLNGLTSFPDFQAYENRAQLLIGEAEEAGRPVLVQQVEEALEAATLRFQHPAKGDRS
jgi:recombination protein RecT